MKKISKATLSSNRGYALVIALILLALGGLIIAPSAILVSSTLKHNQIIEERTQELYSADAGVEFALWTLKNNTEVELPDVGGDPLVLDGLLPDTILNDKSITVSVTNEGDDNYKITSTALGDDGKSSTVESVVEIGTSGTSSVFDFAAAALGGDGECDLDLSGNSEIEADINLEGDIYSIGNVCMSGNSEIDGDATATGDITTSGNAEILGEITENDEDPPYTPNFDIDGFKAEAQAPECASCGGWTDSPDLIISDFDEVVRTDMVCVERDLLVSSFGKATFQDKVKVGRDVNISTMNWAVFNNSLCVFEDLIVGSNAEAEFNGPVKVYGNMTLSSNDDVVFGSTLYVGGNLTITSNIDVIISGTIYIAGDFSNTGNANIVGGETIIVDGNITLTGNSGFNEDVYDIPLIITTQGDVTVTGNSGVTGIIYAPNGDVVLEGNSDVYGAVIAETVSATGNNDLVYPIGLREREDLHDDSQASGEFKIKTYSINQAPD
jgi:predicted acyltransferase (DUF342 family)